MAKNKITKILSNENTGSFWILETDELTKENKCIGFYSSYCEIDPIDNNDGQRGSKFTWKMGAKIFDKKDIEKIKRNDAFYKEFIGDYSND